MAPPTAIVTDPSYPVLRSKVFILDRHNPRYKSSVVALSSSLQANPMLSSNSGSQGFLSSTGAQCKALSALSSPFLGEDDDDLWRKTNVLPLRSRSVSLPRAYKCHGPKCKARDHAARSAPWRSID
ncbi:hypothetical protein V6Z11_A04G139100 [Gossypium hirsutum]